MKFNFTPSSHVVKQGYVVLSGAGNNSSQKCVYVNVDDPSQLAQSVTVTGGGLTNAALTFANGQWSVQDSSAPTLPATYQLTITNKDGTVTTNSVPVTSYVTNLATGITAQVDQNGGINISWNATALAGQFYHVHLWDQYGWHDATPWPGITATNWYYDGGALQDGAVLAAGSVQVYVYIEQFDASGSGLTNSSSASTTINYQPGAAGQPTPSGVQVHVQDVAGNPVQSAVVYGPGSAIHVWTDACGNGRLSRQTGPGSRRGRGQGGGGQAGCEETGQKLVGGSHSGERESRCCRDRATAGAERSRGPRGPRGDTTLR